MSEKKYLTKAELAELERKPQKKSEITLDKLISILPVILALAVIAQYYYTPNVSGAVTTNLFPIIIGFIASIILLIFIISLFNKKTFY